MPVSKNAWIRYRALDACFRNTRKRYYFEDLMDAVNDVLNDFDGSDVGDRQLRQDISDMQSEALGAAPIVKRRDGHRVYYTYEDKDFSILKLPMTQQEMETLNDTIVMLSRFKGMPRFSWMTELIAKLKVGFQLDGSAAGTVAFQQNPYLKGLEWFSDIWDAIIQKRVVELTYRRRTDKEAKCKVMHPYQLRQYNNRWYVIGYEEEQAAERPFTVRALDRIEGVRIVKGARLKRNDTVDFDEYFGDIVGVSLHQGQEPERVVAKVYYPDAMYIDTKPIHGTQRVIEEGEGYKVFEWDIIPNEEFYQQLMIYANRLEMIEPEEVRKEIVKRAEEILEKNKK